MSDSKTLRQEIGYRLKQVRRAHPEVITQAKLDELIGVPEGRTYSYEKGRALAPDGFLKKAARVLDAPFDYLRYGGEWPVNESNQPGSAPPAPYTDGVMHPRVGRRLFPILGTVGAAQFPLSPGEPEEFEEFSDDLYDQAHRRYVIRVVGRSMEKRIFHGDRVLVHPVPNKTVGLIVVAKSEDFEYLIKGLFKKDGEYVLRSANPDFEDIPLDGLELVGVVVGRKHYSGGGYEEEGHNFGLSFEK